MAYDPAIGTGQFFHFPALLCEAREQAGLSVRALARLVSMDATYLSRLERGFAPTPKWPKIAAIAAQLPHSDLAKHTEALGSTHLKQSVLELARDLENLLRSLPASTFEDKTWISAVQNRLRKCGRTITESQRIKG